MSRGKKTLPEDVYKIMISYAVTHSYSETARNLSMPESTVEKIVKEHIDEPEFVKLCEETKDEFVEKALAIRDKAMKKLDDELSGEAYIPVNHLTTVIGTLFDKIALTRGKSTENIKIEIVGPPGADEYAG